MADTVKKGNIFALLDEDEVEEAPKTQPQSKQPAQQSQKQAGQSQKSESQAKQPKQASNNQTQPRQQTSANTATPAKEQRISKDKDRREAPGADRKQRQAYRGSNKREGGGAHNWGKPTDAPAEENEENLELEPEVKEGEEVSEEPKEKPVEFITMSDYLGQEETQEEVKAEQETLLSFRINRGTGGSRGARREGGEERRGDDRRGGRGGRGRGARTEGGRAEGGRAEGGRAEGEKRENEGQAEKKEYTKRPATKQNAPNFEDTNAFPALA